VNVRKHSHARNVLVRFAAEDGLWKLVIEDDGRGFDSEATTYGTGLQGIADRLAALDGILHEAAEWRADLLVVGSHGKGWGKRMLVGSVTERLINHLPASLLVVPAAAAAVRPEAHFSAANPRDIEEHEEEP